MIVMWQHGDTGGIGHRMQPRQYFDSEIFDNPIKAPYQRFDSEVFDNSINAPTLRKALHIIAIIQKSMTTLLSHQRSVPTNPSNDLEVCDNPINVTLDSQYESCNNFDIGSGVKFSFLPSPQE